MQKARIKLSGLDHKVLDGICTEIREIANKSGVRVAGPIPLPTRRLKVPVKKSPCGDGTMTWERWELRIHKRMMDLGVDERAMRAIMRIPVPHGVQIEIELKG